MHRGAALAITGALLLLAGGPTGAGAQTVDDLRFRGDAGGGAVTVTTSPDRTTFVSATVEDVTFPEGTTFPPGPLPFGPCPEATLTDTVHVLDPPPAVTDGGMQLLFVDDIGPGFNSITFFNVAFVSDTRVAGEVSYQAFANGMLCGSDAVEFTAELIDTPPHAGDHRYAGDAPGWSADLALSTTQDGAGLTSIEIAGALPACAQHRNAIAADEPFDGRLFFDPPIAAGAEGFEALMVAAWSGTPIEYERYTFTGRVLDAGIEGTVRVDGLYSNGRLPCSDQASFTLALQEAPTPVAPTVVSVTPTATPRPLALPDAGAGPSSGHAPVTALVALAAGGAGALALALRRR